jgi:hypothetical protein
MRDQEQKRRYNRAYNKKYRAAQPPDKQLSRRDYMRRTRQDGAPKVYFMQARSGPIKIGYTTKQPLGRLKELQAGNHEELTLLKWIPANSRELEMEIHSKFRHLEIRREWFWPGPDLLLFITTV